MTSSLYYCSYCHSPVHYLGWDTYVGKMYNTQEETHGCDHCAAVFYTKYKMDIHLASKHGINDQFKCEKCRKFLMSEWSLLKHKRK